MRGDAVWNHSSNFGNMLTHVNIRHTMAGATEQLQTKTGKKGENFSDFWSLTLYTAAPPPVSLQNSLEIGKAPCYYH